MKRYAKKKWGQNFLVDKNLLGKIVRTLNLKSEDRILEIGPGEGALTELMLPAVEQMVAVEIDPELIAHLRSLKDLQSCHFLHKDILLLDLDSLPLALPVRVMGNIPYNITSPILFWLIKQRSHWSDAYLMVQKEMAERLTGRVGTKAYGRLTVMIGVFIDVKICFNISPNVFIPKPKVESSIIRLVMKPKPLIRDDQFKQFEKIVQSAFSQRRKMLRNSLKEFKFHLKIQEEIDFRRRPETLLIQEFVKLLQSR